MTDATPAQDPGIKGSFVPGTHLVRLKGGNVRVVYLSRSSCRGMKRAFPPAIVIVWVCTRGSTRRPFRRANNTWRTCRERAGMLIVVDHSRILGEFAHKG